MKRTNTFTVAPLSETTAEILHQVMDAVPSLWNELNHARQDAFFNGGNVWEISQDDFRKKYLGVLGSATAQQVIRKNDEAWRSFFNSDKPGKGLPGYWGNREEGRELQTYIRNRDEVADLIGSIDVGGSFKPTSVTMPTRLRGAHVRGWNLQLAVISKNTMDTEPTNASDSKSVVPLVGTETKAG